jgi:hypothetical protein
MELMGKFPADSDNGIRPQNGVVVSLVSHNETGRIIIDRAERKAEKWIPWSMVTFRDFKVDDVLKMKLSRADRLALADWVLATMVALHQGGTEPDGRGASRRKISRPRAKKSK